MEKQAIKELMYGGIKEIMSNNRYYYRSMTGRQFSSFTENGQVAVHEFITEIAAYIIDAENEELDKRAKDMVLKTLKSKND